jgi:UDPglucose--hexose-1-phosphate uridylyltransferase
MPDTGHTMAKYVPDIGSRRWVIIAPGRSARPSENKKEKQTATPLCPFCVGNERMTPPELYRIGTGEKDMPGWQVRVVPNKYPITDTHEVIIHSTDDTLDIEDLPLEQVVRILTAYRDRYRAHDDAGQVLIFCNHGFAAGASLKHPHSQLVVIPKQINLDAVSREPVANVVEDNTYFITYCPDFSQWPFEVWIAPKVEGGGKFSGVTDGEISDLARVLQNALRRIRSVQKVGGVRSVHEAFVYNFYISHADNWFIRITPRFVHRAGFELGTGLNVNVTDPTEAAKILREMTI